MKGSSWNDRLAWVERHSPLTRAALARFPSGSRSPLLMSFHLDLKMVPVILGLSEKLPLSVFACNPHTVDPQSLEHLAKFSRCELLTREEALGRWTSGQQAWPFLCDLGGELIVTALADRSLRVSAAMEGTSSGVCRVKKALAGRSLPFPVVDWNAAPLKLSLHNEKMVGFSLWQTFTEVTRLSLHGKCVGVFGFGPVGRGVARTARSLGGSVVVFDPDAAASTIAGYEGFPVLSREALLQSAEVIVTATGRPGVLRLTDLTLFRDGAFLLNAGHSCDEWESELREHPHRQQVLENVEELPSGQGSIYLLSRGELLNLGAGFGDTINAFDLTTAQLVEAIAYLYERGAELPPGWHDLPPNFSARCLGQR